MGVGGACSPPTEHHGGGHTAAHGSHCSGEGLERLVSRTLCMFLIFLQRGFVAFITSKAKRETQRAKKNPKTDKITWRLTKDPRSSREASQIANTQNASGRSYSSFPQSSPDQPVSHQITSDKSHIPSSSALQHAWRGCLKTTAEDPSQHVQRAASYAHLPLLSSCPHTPELS